ncbi:hypothetical protein EV401DRAFT_1909017 [Pisolithus croceorrhizus]|nr:hypothetical protein EV401DRAFT_1909017 [Pisolithus croceorrhizus]
MARQRWLSGEPLALQALSAAMLCGASTFLFLSSFPSQRSGNDEGWWISDKRPRIWHRQGRTIPQTFSRTVKWCITVWLMA